MKKYIKFVLTGFILIGLSMFSCLTFEGAKIASAGGDVEIEYASIGFEVADKYSSNIPSIYVAEKNGGEQTLKICVSEAQETDTIFTLSESIVIPDITSSPDYIQDMPSDEYFALIEEWEDYWQRVFNSQGNVFNYETSYTLPAGETFVFITLTQNSNAENINKTRIRQIAISTTSETVVPGYEPTIFGLKSIMNVFVYDLNGANSIIIGLDDSISNEKDVYKTFKIIRTGDNSLKDIAPSFQYKLINYDDNNEKELQFETIQSSYVFKVVNGKYETEATLKLKFFDNERLNWQSVYTLQFSSFFLCGTEYLNNNLFAMQEFDNNIKTSFFIEDDELAMIDCDATVALSLSQTNPYIIPMESYDAILPEQGGSLSYEIYTRPSTGKSVEEYRLFYTINNEKTSAMLGTDFNLQNYSATENIGYIDFAATAVNEDSIGILQVETLNNNLLDGARTLFLQFFLSSDNTNILLPAKDFLSLAVWDDEYLAENNTISWADNMFNSGASLSEGVVTFNSSIQDCIIDLFTDYTGNMNYTIPVMYTDITAKRGIDYDKDSFFDYLTLQTHNSGFEYWGTNLNILNNGKFYGTKRFQVTILEDFLPEGFSVSGLASIYVDLLGDYEKDYCYTNTPNVSIYRDEDICFNLFRSETTAYTNYITLENTTLEEGVHYQTGLFPYAVTWQEGETQKNISIPLLNFTSEITDFFGTLVFENSQQNTFNISFGFESVSLTILNTYEQGEFYFGASEYTYQTSIGSLDVEVMRTSTSGNATIDYSLTALTGLTEDEMAEIGIDIDDIHGTLTFLNGENLKTISITIPELIRKIVNRKIGLTLSNPSRYSGIEQEQIILTINDDTAPYFVFQKNTLSYAGAIGEDELKYKFFPVSSQNTSSVSFEIGIVATENRLPVDAIDVSLVMYSLRNMYDEGIEIWIGDQQIFAEILDTPYEESGRTYNFAYYYQADLCKDVSTFEVVLTWNRIYDILPIFAGNFFNVNVSSPNINLPLTNVLVSADPNIQEMPTISMTLDDDTMGNNDSIAITVSRTWQNRYLRQSFKLIAVGGEANMYEPLDEIITFEPFQEEILVLFDSLEGNFDINSNQPTIQLMNLDNSLIQQINVYIYSNPTTELIKLQVGFSENEEVEVVEVGMEKTVSLTFILSRTYMYEITIPFVNLHPALSATPLVFPAGVTEVTKTFTINGLLLTDTSSRLRVSRDNFPLTINTITLSVRSFQFGWDAISTLSTFGIPEVQISNTKIYETSSANLSILYSAGETPITSLPQRLVYCQLLGNAVLGVDYVLVNSYGPNIIYDTARDAFIIPTGTNRLQGIIRGLRTNGFDENKTITFVFYELTEDGTRYAERTYNIEILQNDTYGQLSITSTKLENESYQIQLTNNKNTGIPFVAILKLESLLGVYGTDYVITNATFVDEENNLFYVEFDGITKNQYLFVEFLTNARCSLSLGLETYPTSHIEVLNGKVSISSTVHITPNIIDELENAETAMSSYATSSEANYYFDYQYRNYYYYYQSGNATFVARQVDFYGNCKLYDVIYTYKTNAGKIITTAKISNGTYTSYEITIPSKVNANHWTDVNGDGAKEMIFASCYPYSFYGGNDEADDYGKFGVYYIDFVNGQVGTILPLTKAEANRYIEFYISDLTCDGKDEITVFMQNSPVELDRYNLLLGDNSFYILSNTVQTGVNFEIGYYESGYRIINGEQMRLVNINSYDYDYEVPHIVLRFINRNDYDVYSNRLLSATCVSKSLYGHDKYKNISINYIPSEVVESENFSFNMHNPSGLSGTFTINYEGITAVAIRDFPVNGLVTYSFRQGEKDKNISIPILNNYLPNDDLTFRVTLTSQDYFLGNKTVFVVTIKDRTTINKNITYTFQDAFNVDLSVNDASAYEQTNSYITGDNAIITAKSLIINGLSVFNSTKYFPRLTATFGGVIVVDDQHNGYLNLTDLISLSNGQDGGICVTIDFMQKNGNEITNRVLSTITTNIPYLHYLNYQTSNIITTTDQIAVGQKANIEVYSSFDSGQANTHKISVTYVNTADNTTQTYYSDGSGTVRFSVNGGNISGAYNNHFTVNNLTTGASQTYEHILSVYGEKIAARITATSDIKAALLGSVKIKIVGVDVAFFAEGTTNSSTGIFTTELIPFKTYGIYFNEGNAINYLNEVVYTLTNAKFENATINMNLTLRNQNTQIKNVRVFIHNKEQIVNLVDGPIYDLYYNKGGTLPFSARSIADFIYSNLNGTLRRNLTYQEQLIMRCYFEALTDYTYMERMGLRYVIGNDIFLGTPDLKIYKSLQKEESDVIAISYQYYPVYSAATVTLRSSGLPLTSSNAIMLNYNTTDYYGNSYQQFFVARTGISDNLIDMEITSESYSTGTKTIQLVSLGAAMGRMLAGGINEQLAQIKTAEVPSYIKFMDGMSFALTFAGQEIGYDVDEEEQTMSIYIGLSKTIFERSHGAKYQNQDIPSLAELRGAKKGGLLSSGSGGFGFAVGLGGKMHFKYVDEEWRLLAGEIYISVSASYNYTKYFIVPVVNFPAFFSATVTLSMTNTVMFDWNEAECKTDVTGELAIALALEIEVGLGIRGFFSASVFALGTIEVVIQYHTGGAKLTLSVCGGVRIQIIFWKYEVIFAETSWSTQSNGYVERSSVYSTKLKNMMPSTSYAGVAKIMNNNGEVAMEMALNQYGEVEDITVVENIFESAVPQLAELSDGTKMIAWINQDAERGENNSELINYIYYNGEQWSDVEVMDTTITADLYFDIKPYGNTFAISYSEVKETLGAGSTLSDRLQLSEIAFSVFDKNTMTFSKVKLTDNNLNDRIVMFEMTGDTGIMVVYQSQNNNISDEMTLNEFLCGENSNNRLLYSIYSQGSWGTLKTLQTSLPAIVNLSLKVVSSIAYIAIETDNDNNFDTDIDREIVLIQYIFANQVISKTIITENEVSDTDPSLSSFNGNLILVFKSGDDVVYFYNNNFSTITTLPAGQPNFSFYSNENYSVISWSQAVDGKSQIFASIMTADTNVFSAPYQVTTGENNKSNAFATMNNGNLFIYYCEDIYTPVGTDGEFTVARNIKLTAVDLFSDLQIEVLPVDSSTFEPNLVQLITIRIHNNGNIAVENPSVAVNISGVITNYEITAVIPGLSYIDYDIELSMPQTKTTFVFSIEKENLIESDTSNNTASIDLMKVDLAISGYTITRTQTGLQLLVTIENKSNVDASNIILSLTKYSNTSIVFDSLNISSLAAKTQATYTLNIDNSDISYNSIQIFWSKLFILTPDTTIYTVEDDDYNTGNNTRSLSIKRAQLEGNETLVALNQTVSLFVGQTYILNYIYTGTGTLNISSSNTQIVSILDGKITGTGSGEATITLTDGTATKTINISVAQNSYSIELVGNQTQYLSQGEAYVENGVNCIYNGEQIDGTVRITNPLDPDIVGTYQIFYDYIVDDIVVASVSRIVVVKPQKAFATISAGVISGYALQNSTIILYNSSHDEVARTVAENGQFSFDTLTNPDDYSVVVLVEGVESEGLGFTILEIEHGNTIASPTSPTTYIAIYFASHFMLACISLAIVFLVVKKHKKM